MKTEAITQFLVNLASESANGLQSPEREALREAADALEAQAQEIARLREALEEIASMGIARCPCRQFCFAPDEALRVARRALDQGDDR